MTRITLGIVFNFRRIAFLRFGDGEPAHFHMASFSGVSFRLVTAFVVVSWSCNFAGNWSRACVPACPLITAFRQWRLLRLAEIYFASLAPGVGSSKRTTPRSSNTCSIRGGVATMRVMSRAVGHGAG